MDGYQIDDSILERIKLKVKNKKFTKTNVLCENSVIKSVKELKTYLILYEFKKDKCDLCKCDAFWNNKVLDLIIYYKNGKKADNRLENIQILCPNCHSQKKNKSIYIKSDKSKMIKCIDCHRRIKKKVVKETINPVCDVIDPKQKKHTYIRKRCQICLDKMIQMRDYQALNSI